MCERRPLNDPIHGVSRNVQVTVVAGFDRLSLRKLVYHIFGRHLTELTTPTGPEDEVFLSTAGLHPPVIKFLLSEGPFVTLIILLIKNPLCTQKRKSKRVTAERLPPLL